MQHRLQVDPLVYGVIQYGIFGGVNEMLIDVVTGKIVGRMYTDYSLIKKINHVRHPVALGMFDRHMRIEPPLFVGQR